RRCPTRTDVRGRPSFVSISSEPEFCPTIAVSLVLEIDVVWLHAGERLLQLRHSHAEVRRVIALILDHVRAALPRHDRVTTVRHVRLPRICGKDCVVTH